MIETKVNFLVNLKDNILDLTFDNLVQFTQYLAENGNEFLNNQISKNLNKAPNLNPSKIQLTLGQIGKKISDFCYRTLSNNTRFDVKIALQVLVSNIGSGVVGITGAAIMS